jgi:hypothetical protein
MDWLNQLGGLLQQYSGSGGRQGSLPDSALDDFDRIAQQAPQQDLAAGLSETFRSPDTAPFPDMLAQLFGNSGGPQKATVLNSLMGALGPAVLGGLLAKFGGGAAGLGGLLGQGTQQITPEMAEQVPPEAIQQAAAEAERRDPSIIDQLGDFYAQQPQIVKSLGAAALTYALYQIGKRNKLL